jgi:hypothetical protein
MRLVTREELMKLPAGTIYQEFIEDVNDRMFPLEVAGKFFVKGETLMDDEGLPFDWFTSEVGSFSEDRRVTIERLKAKESVEIFADAEERDGWFALEREYLVLEELDILRVKQVFSRALWVIDKVKERIKDENEI